MRYLIDGYNLLHAMGVLCGKVGPRGLEKARLSLLELLCADGGGAEVTVVFDASGALRHAAAEDDYRGIHIRYAVEGEADDVIEDLIRREPAPRQLTVVSDDHRLQQAARRRRCVVCGCLDFLEQRQRSGRSTPAAESPGVKPESVSEEEARHWLRVFADRAADP